MPQVAVCVVIHVHERRGPWTTTCRTEHQLARMGCTCYSSPRPLAAALAAVQSTISNELRVTGKTATLALGKQLTATLALGKLFRGGVPAACVLLHHKADPFFDRSRVRFHVPPWVSNTIARDHLALHRRRPFELRAVIRRGFPGGAPRGLVVR